MSDQIYYNALITNPNSSGYGVISNYEDNMNSSLLQKASDYKMSIVRFFIPGSTLPIFVFNTTANYYKVTLTYQGIQGTATLVYIPNKPGLNINDPYYYYVSDYEHMIRMINIALETAYTNLLAALAVAVITPPTGLSYAPWFNFSATTNLLTLSAPKAGYLATDPYALWNNVNCNAVEIWCNQNLVRFLSAFQFIYPRSTALAAYTGVTTDLYQKFIVADQYDNHDKSDRALASGWLAATTYAINAIVELAGSYYISRQNANTGNTPLGTAADAWWAHYNGFESYIMEQEYVALYNWNDPQSIVFTSSNLPIQSEILPSNTSTGEMKTRSIITDFLINTNIGSEIRSAITYYPTAQFRYISLTNSDPIRRITVNAFWADKTNTYYPIYVEVGTAISIKFLFEKIKK